jgi:hypothetical protein
MVLENSSGYNTAKLFHRSLDNRAEVGYPKEVGKKLAEVVLGLRLYG